MLVFQDGAGDPGPVPATTELILDPGFLADNIGWKTKCTPQSESFELMPLRLDVDIKTILGYEVVFKENNHKNVLKKFML